MRPTSIAVGRPDAVVAHGELAVAPVARAEVDEHVAGPPPGEGVLEGVGDELVDDEPARHRAVHVEVEVAAGRRHLDPLAGEVVSAHQLVAEARHVRRHRHVPEIAGAVEVLVHQRHRAQPAADLGEELHHLAVLRPRRLEAEQAADELEVVLHAVVDLFQDRALLAHRALEALLLALGGGDVLHGAGEGDAAADVERVGDDVHVLDAAVGHDQPALVLPVEAVARGALEEAPGALGVLGVGAAGHHRQRRLLRRLELVDAVGLARPADVAARRVPGEAAGVAGALRLVEEVMAAPQRRLGAPLVLERRLELAVKPRVLERDRSLRGDDLEERDAARREGAGRAVVLEVEDAEELLPLDEGQAEDRLRAGRGEGGVVAESRRGRAVGGDDRLALRGDVADDGLGDRGLRRRREAHGLAPARGLRLHRELSVAQKDEGAAGGAGALDGDRDQPLDEPVEGQLGGELLRDLDDGGHVELAEGRQLLVDGVHEVGPCHGLQAPPVFGSGVIAAVASRRTFVRKRRATRPERLIPGRWPCGGPARGFVAGRIWPLGPVVGP